MLLRPQLRTGFRVPSLHHKDRRSIFRHSLRAATQETTQLHSGRIKVKHINTWIATKKPAFQLTTNKTDFENFYSQYKHDD